VKKTRKLVELCGFKFAVVYTAFYIVGRIMLRFFEILNCKEKAQYKTELLKRSNNIRTLDRTNIINDPPRNATFLNLFSIRGFRPFPFLPVSTPPSPSWHFANSSKVKEISKCQTRLAHGF